MHPTNILAPETHQVADGKSRADDQEKDEDKGRAAPSDDDSLLKSWAS